MRVSQRLDYGLRALVLLAQQPAGSWIAAGDLAERLGLPRRFVEQQISVLSRGGITECRRGATGGCRLLKAPGQVTVKSVIEVLQGAVLDVPRQQDSATAEFWQQAAEQLEDFASSTTLEDLATRQREHDAVAASLYHI